MKNNSILRVLGQRGRTTIPFAIRMKMGFKSDDVLRFTPSDDGKTLMVKREKLCDSCKTQELSATKERDAVLQELLDELTPTELHTALIHLSVRWAQTQQGDAALGAAH